jgi:Flp pilus assembly protein TadD
MVSMTDSIIRGAALGFLVLLCACSSRGANGVGSGPPGIEVADAALKGGSPQIALQVSDSILARSPGNQDALLTKGDALTALGQSDDAAVVFAQVLSSDPGSVSANIGLGRIRLASNPVASEQMFLEAIKREPRNNVAWNDLGIARDLQGRHIDAQSAYRRALGINPEMSAAQVNLALSMAMTGQSHEAVQLLQPLASKPDASQQTRHDLAAVLTMSGDRDGAARILSTDLPPEQVQQALSAFASAQPNAAAAMLGPASPAISTSPAAAPAESSPAVATQPVSAPTPTPVTLAPLPSSKSSVAAPTESNTPVPTQTAAASPATNTSEDSNAAGPIQVQLAGPVASKDAAEIKWGRLSRALPNELGGHQPIMAEEQEHGHTVWRVRTGGFSDASQANALCEQVRNVGASCRLLQ